MYIRPAFAIEEMATQDITMTRQQVNWDELEALFEQIINDEELEEVRIWLLEVDDFENTPIPDELADEVEAWFLDTTLYVRQQDNVFGYLHNWMKAVTKPERYKDLLEYLRIIRGETKKILKDELGIIGPLRFRLGTVVRISKFTNEGVVYDDYYTVQKDPILVNEGITDEELDKILERLAAEQEEQSELNSQARSGFVVEGMSRTYLNISVYDPIGHIHALSKVHPKQEGGCKCEEL